MLDIKLVLLTLVCQGLLYKRVPLRVMGGVPGGGCSYNACYVVPSLHTLKSGVWSLGSGLATLAAEKLSRGPSNRIDARKASSVHQIEGVY